jgi:hypothetical protein
MIVEVQAESPDPAYPATPASGPAMGRASEPVAPATTTPSPRSGQNLRGCTTEEVIQFWITDRATPPKNKAIKARRSKMAAFFAWAHKPDDVTQITAEDLQNYKQHLVRAHGNNHARDHLFDLCSLIRIAADNGKLRDAAGKVISKPNTPADAITLPAKRDGLPRPAFSDHEARTLLLAARDHVLPIVKWGTRLGAGLGLITSVFADANVRDVEMMDGIACLCIRTENRTTDVKGLKTGARVRYMPLPTTWRDEFLAYADGVRQMHGDKAPLFADIPADRDGQRNTKASAEIMRFIRGCGIENVTDPDTGTVIELRDSYSWRHRFASKLESIAIVKDPATGKEIANKSDRQRYLCGHAGKDVHGKVYLEHLPRETLHIIDAIRDPTANDPEYAEAAE